MKSAALTNNNFQCFPNGLLRNIYKRLLGTQHK